MIGQTVSHYKIVGQLGQGGMGVVYEAEDTQLGRHVALKFLPEKMANDATALQRFQREARAASSLNHPNICTIYAIDQHESQYFFAMELIDGQPLTKRILDRTFQIDQILDMSAQIADALEVAHSKGIIHRDIKPANIFINERGQVKVLDFGLAKQIFAEPTQGEESPTAVDDLTKTGTTMGTVSYMSPEQARGQSTDARTDLFSFGTVIYQMATGNAPFPGETSAVVFDAILNRDPVPPLLLNSKLPPELQRIIEKCLEKDRAMRYQTAKELRTDLLRLKRDLESGSRPTADSGSKPGAIAARLNEKALVVLYFENLSGAKEDEYFRDGMTEDIITELSKIKDLKVFPRPTVLPYRDKPVTATQVGQQLGAAYVLGGSIRRAGNRLRINAQLVDTRTDFPMWSERYDREMKDVFEVQDEMARNIAQALRITLSPQEEQELERKPTANTQAYDFYLRGRGYARRLTRADLELAVQMFERAIELDPEFAMAYAGLSLVYSLFFEWHGKEAATMEKALATCERALSLQANLPEGLGARARINYTQHKYDEAIGYARQALKLKPDCESANWCLGQAYFSSGRYQDAMKIADSVVEAAGDDYNVYVPLMVSAEKLGMTEKATEFRKQQTRMIRQHLDSVPEDVRARILLACNYAAMGTAHEAIAELKTAVALRPKDANVLYNAACAYALLGRKQEAIALLTRSKEAGFLNLDWATKDPDLTCLHQEPEFQALISSETAKANAGEQ